MLEMAEGLQSNASLRFKIGRQTNRVEACFEISVSAGITEGGPDDDIELLIERAERESKDNSEIPMRQGGWFAMKKYSLERL